MNRRVYLIETIQPIIWFGENIPTGTHGAVICGASMYTVSFPGKVESVCTPEFCKTKFKTVRDNGILIKLTEQQLEDMNITFQF
jgi:hypothetical protein